MPQVRSTSPPAAILQNGLVSVGGPVLWGLSAPEGLS